jgi:hypothetical protein
MGKPADAPDGWFVYCQGLPCFDAQKRMYYQSVPGVFRSALRTFAPSVIPSTEQDYQVQHIDITEDGQWLCYSAVALTPEQVRTGETGTRKLYMCRATGGGRVEVPVTRGDENALLLSGVVRRSPYVSEVFYLRATREIVAVRVDLTKTPPTFGATRVLATGIEFDARDTMAVSGNHMQVRIGELARSITIPDGGKGIATAKNLWKYTGVCKWGCSVTMSWDGLLTVNNPTHLGEYTDAQLRVLRARGIEWTHDNGVNPDPRTCFQTEHEGFVVLPFKEDTMPPLSVTDYYFGEAVSCNWVAPELRGRGTRRNDFSDWCFSNSRDYVIGTERGPDAPIYGAWLVHWPTNTWTLLTSPDTHAMGSAVYLTDPPAPAPIAWRKVGDVPPEVPAVAPVPAKPAWPGSQDDLLFCWRDALGANTVRRDGADAWTCRVEPRGRAVLGRNGQMQTAGGYFVAPEADDLLLQACKTSNQLTLAALVTMPATTPTGADPQVIVGFAGKVGSRNFALVQVRDTLILQLRTARQGSRGVPTDVKLMDGMKPGKTYHIVVTYSPGSLHGYVNGTRQLMWPWLVGGFGNWEPERLIFGADGEGRNGWGGDLACIALYSRVLGPLEVTSHADLAVAMATARPPAVRTVVRARLIATSPLPTAAQIAPYRQALVVHRYEVVQVVKGILNTREIAVAQWAVLDAQPVATAARTVGATYLLTLEPFDAYPHLAGIARNDDAAGDAPVYFEATR